MSRAATVYVPADTQCLHLQPACQTGSFFDSACYRFYWLRLLSCHRSFQVRLHAAVLLPRAIWLLLTPQHVRGLDHLLKFLNHSYSAYYKLRFGHGNLVWQHPADASVMESDQLTLECQKFIELLPVHERLVEHPGRYQWSTYCEHAFGGKPRRTYSHNAYRMFIKENSRSGYRDYVAAGFSAARWDYFNYRLSEGMSLRGARPRRNNAAVAR